MTGDDDGISAEAFRKMAEEVRDAVVEDAPFCSCGSRIPYYPSMSEGERAYYFYWRSRLLEGDCLKADAGFLNLFVCERIALGCGFEAVRDALEAARYVGAFPPKVIDPLMFDACLYFDRPVPDWVQKLDYKLRQALLTVRLSGPLRFYDDLSTVLECPVHDMPEDDRIIYNKAFNHGIKSLDSYSMKFYGKNLLEKYSDAATSVEYTPFNDMPVEKLRVRFDLYVTGSTFQTIVNGAAVCCMSSIFGSKAVYPFGFKDEWRLTVGRAVRNPLDLGAWEDSGPRAVPVTIVEDMRPRKTDDLQPPAEPPAEDSGTVSGEAAEVAEEVPPSVPEETDTLAEPVSRHDGEPIVSIISLIGRKPRKRYVYRLGSRPIGKPSGSAKEGMLEPFKDFRTGLPAFRSIDVERFYCDLGVDERNHLRRLVLGTSKGQQLFVLSTPEELEDSINRESMKRFGMEMVSSGVVLPVFYADIADIVRERDAIGRRGR